VQAVGVFVAGDVAAFIAFGGDFSVGVVAVFALGAAWQHDANQPTDAVPLIPGQRTMLILARHLPAKLVIAITLDPAIGQLLLKQLPAFIPHQPMATVIRVPHPHQLPISVVAVVGNVAIGIGPARDVALVIALVLPDRFTTPHNPYETVVMLVGRRLVVPGNSAASVNFRDRWPSPERGPANRRPSRLFRTPRKTRPTGQPAFENDVLLVVPINLAFTNGIGRRDQSARFVVGVGNDVLFSHPLERFRPLAR
jgi:hypothetical protein